MRQALLRRDGIDACDILTSNIISYLLDNRLLPQYDIAVHYFVPTRQVPGARNLLFYQQIWEHERHDLDRYLREFDRAMTCSYELTVVHPDVLYFPLAVDPGVYRPRAPQDAYKCEVVFVGNFACRTRDVYDRCLLPALDFDLAIYGSEWDAPEARGYSRAWRGLLSPQEAPSVYASAALSLNMTARKYPGLTPWQVISSRVYHSLACERMVVSDAYPHIQSVFPERQGVVYTDGGGHATALIQRYLDDAQARGDVAKAGMRRVQRQHTWDVRAGYLLRELGCG